MKIAALATAAAVLALAGAAQAAPELVTNGGFEAGNGGPGPGGYATLGNGATNMTGWTVGGDSYGHAPARASSSAAASGMTIQTGGVNGVNRPGQLRRLCSLR